MSYDHPYPAARKVQTADLSAVAEDVVERLLHGERAIGGLADNRTHFQFDIEVLRGAEAWGLIVRPFDLAVRAAHCCAGNDNR